MPDESKLTGWIGPDGKPEIYRTPLQALAAHLKSLTWAEMEAFADAADARGLRGSDDRDESFTNFARAMLAAAEALEAGE